MAGYRLKKRRLKLEFEGGFYEGVEIGCNLSASAGLVKEVQDAAIGEDIDILYALARDQVILDWNLEDEEGNPIPLNDEGFRQVDHNLVMTIINSWLQNIGKIDHPLESASSNGHTPAPALAQMGSFTESRVNPSTTDG